MDAIAGNASTTEIIVPGGSRTSTIDTPGDQDWFRVTLEGDLSYSVFTEGTGTATELNRVEFSIRDDAGNVLQSENEADFNGVEVDTFTPSADGIFYISAEGFSGTSTEDYTIFVGTDDVRRGADTQSTIAPGGSVNGRIDALGDQDSFEITLEADLSYRVFMEGTGTVSELNRVEFLI